MAFVYRGAGAAGAAGRRPRRSSCASRWWSRAGTVEELVALLDGVAPKAERRRARGAVPRAGAAAGAHGRGRRGARRVEARCWRCAPRTPRRWRALGGCYVARAERAGAARGAAAPAGDGRGPGSAARRCSSRWARCRRSSSRTALGALATFRRLLELKPDDAAALERMESLCQKQERWPELADVLARRIALMPPEEALELEVPPGHGARDEAARQGGRAGRSTARCSPLQPNHAGALARMEALVAREPQNLLAVDVLLQGVPGSGDIAKLAQLIEARVGVSPDAFERKALLAGAGHAARDAGRAGAGLPRAVPGVQGRPERRASCASGWRAPPTPPRRTTSWSSAYEEALPRIAEAADAARGLPQAGPDAGDAAAGARARDHLLREGARSLPALGAREALPALDRLYVQLEAWPELAGVLERWPRRATEPAGEGGLPLPPGAAVRRSGWTARTARRAAYEQILDARPAHLPSARLLEQLTRRRARTTSCTPSSARSASASAGRSASASSRKMAQVSAEGLADLDHSIELYRELLAKNPRNEQAFTALEGAAGAARAGHEELRELLAGRLAHTLDPRELVRLNERLGRVRLPAARSSPRRPCRTSRPALERDARHRGALESAARHLRGAGAARRAGGRAAPAGAAAGGRGGREGACASGWPRCWRRWAGARRRWTPPAGRWRSSRTRCRSWTGSHAHLRLAARPTTTRCARWSSRCTVHLAAGGARAGGGHATSRWRTCGEGPANKPESRGAALEKVLELDPANRHGLRAGASTLYRGHNDWRAYAGSDGPLPAAPRHRRGEARLAARAGAGAGAAARAEGRGVPGAVPRAAARRRGRRRCARRWSGWRTRPARTRSWPRSTRRWRTRCRAARWPSGST